MKIGSASTSIAGQRSARVAARVQCVVTRCPSSAPVAAAIIAPEQTVTSRVERSMSAAIAATAAASSITARMPNPPGMISVSTGPGCVRDHTSSAWESSATALCVDTVPPRNDTIVTS